MTQTFVYVGSAPGDMMGVVSFRAFGQRASLTEEQAGDLAVGGSHLVREETWDGLKFAPADVAKWGQFGALPHAPAEFQEKRRLAIAAAVQLRAECETARQQSAEVEA
jgi:hypothetical protein